MPMDSSKTVMLVDDHPLFRRGLKDVINTKTEFRVIAEADNGVAAIALSRIHDPAVTIIDLALPDRNGLQVIRELKSTNSTSQFVVLTLHNDMSLVEEALSIGASAYLMKSDGIDVVEDCLSNIANREVYVSPSVSVAPPLKPLSATDDKNWNQTLSSREKEVLLGIAQNKTSKEIAAAMNLSVRTVQNHRARIARKLDLQGANALYRFALQNAS